MTQRSHSVRYGRPAPGQTRILPSGMGRAYRVNDPAIASAEPGTPIPFLLSSPGTKRDGLNLATLPFTLDNYVRNPVVLPFHSYFDFPIGRGTIEALSTPSGQALYALAEFDMEDEMGAIADAKYRRGFLFAVSLGWDDIDANGIPTRSSKKKPVARDVLEFSVVSVPGDADALIDDGGRSMDAEEISGQRGFLIAVQKVLTAADPRADVIEETLERLAACSGDECRPLLANARELAGIANDQDAEEHGPESTEGEPTRTNGRAPADEAEAEARRRAAMAAMVAAVWCEEGYEPDDRSRKNARAALISEYNRLGLVTPAYLDAAIVAKLPFERRAALFVNGELEELGMIDRSGTGIRVGKAISGSNRTKLEGARKSAKDIIKTLDGLLAEESDGERASGKRCTCGGHSALPAALDIEEDDEGERGAEDDGGGAPEHSLEDYVSTLSKLYPAFDIVVQERGERARKARAAAPKGGARQVASLQVTEVGESEDDYAYSSGEVVLPDLVQQYLEEKMRAALDTGPDGTKTAMYFSKQPDNPDWPITPMASAAVNVTDSIPTLIMSMLRAMAAGGDPELFDIEKVLGSDPDWSGGAAEEETPEEEVAPEEEVDVPAEEPATLSIEDLFTRLEALQATAN